MQSPYGKMSVRIIIRTPDFDGTPQVWAIIENITYTNNLRGFSAQYSVIG